MKPGIRGTHTCLSSTCCKTTVQADIQHLLLATKALKSSMDGTHLCTHHWQSAALLVFLQRHDARACCKLRRASLPPCTCATAAAAAYASGHSSMRKNMLQAVQALYLGLCTCTASSVSVISALRLGGCAIARRCVGGRLSSVNLWALSP